MLRILIFFISALLIACSKDKPVPTAPAAKASNFDGFLDLFNSSDDQQPSSEPDTTQSQSESEPDTTQSLSEPDPATAFNIELIFHGDDFSALERQIIAETAASWEYRLGDVPDYRLTENIKLYNCSGGFMTLEKGRVIDDVIVYVSKLPKEQRLDEADNTVADYAVPVHRPTLSQDGRPLPAAVCFAIGDWKKGPLGAHEHKAFVQEAFMGALDHMLDALGEFAQDSVVDLPDDDTFDIELIFLDEFDPMEKEIMVEETAHWEKMLGDIPAYQFGFQSYLSNCGDHPIEMDRGRVVDDVIMYVAKLPKDAAPGVAGLAGVWQERTTPDRLPAVGCVMMGEWRSGPRGTNRHKAFIQDVFLHEMGHALGVGSGYNWSKFVVWEEDSSGVHRAHFAGPSAIAAYDGLPRLIGPDPDAPPGPLGGSSRALVAQPGGVLYKGKKVPLLDGGHWGETIGGELVAYDPVVEIDRWPKLSVVSLGALEDMGYPVRYENADPFWVELDAPAGKPTTSFLCGVGRGFLKEIIYNSAQGW